MGNCECQSLNKMNKTRIILLLCFVLCYSLTANVKAVCNDSQKEAHLQKGFTDAADFGFSPSASGKENTLALQKAVEEGGTITVSIPGTYNMAGTVYIGSNTTIVFGNNVFLKKVNEEGDFTHVLLNKGALTKTYNEHISIEGLNIIVNGMDKPMNEVFGLRGQIAFFYVKDLKIERFRCYDLAKMQFGIHVCTFEDLIIDDVVIHGKKDGIHLGRGNRYTIRNGVFKCFDDAIALNGHDYATSNPELGWIENGVVENCYDLNEDETTGYFCRILAGAWIDWKPGMEVQQSDAVISNGRLYRVQMEPDGTVYKSFTRPTHETGSKVLDGIKWGVVQEDITYTAGVRNVSFQNIFLEKPRTGFSIHFDNGPYSRSYYPGAEIPMQEQISFDNIRVLHDEPIDLIDVSTPVDVFTVSNSSIRDNKINFYGNKAMSDYPKTQVNIYGCTFQKEGSYTLIRNSVKDKQIFLKTSSNIELNNNFSASVVPGEGQIIVESDLTGLKDKKVFSQYTGQSQDSGVAPVQELKIRSGLPNFYSKAGHNDTVRVAYLGGSITAQEGWRVYSRNWMQKQFPQTNFVEINAAIGGTGSDFGVFRLTEHVLQYKPDLVFVEFAVNDDRKPSEKIIRSMEGIVRQIWQMNPQTDICFIYTIKGDYLETELAGKLPASVVEMEKVADWYKIPSINFGAEISKQISAGKLILKDDKKEISGIPVFSADGVHPYIETGHLIYENVLERSFGKMKENATVSAHELGDPILSNYFSDTKMLELDSPALTFSGNWQFKNIKKEDGEFSQFSKYLNSIATADKTGATLNVKFKGQAIGFYDLMCYDGGRVVVEIDGAVTDTIPRFDKYCTYRRMHYFIIDNLENKRHKVVFKLLSEPFDKGSIITNKNDYAENPEKYRENNWYVGKILVDGELLD